MSELIEIRWHGRAGQGVVTAGELLAEAALDEGKYFQAFPDYGPERMGAPVKSYTRISDEPIDFHCQILNPDVVIVVNPNLLSVVDVTEGLKPDGTLIINTPETPAEIRKALRDAHWHEDGEIGLVLGTAWGCMDSLELFAEKLVGGNPKFVSPLPFTHSYANAPNSLAAIEFKLRGFSACFTCGHVSGMAAVECACQRVELGKDARVLAGGSESLSEPVFHGYDLRGLLHAGGDPRPYDAGSDGMILGEGAAVFAIESAEAARERHATVFARMLGHASTAGRGLADALGRAMAAALERGGVAPADVDLVVGAGCGLPELDGAELEAIRAVFGDARPMLTSVKRLLGEGMGAGGPMSLCAAVIACLEDRAVPPVVLDETPSPEGVDLVSGEGRPADVRTVLVNAADPGGSCISLLIAFPDS